MQQYSQILAFISVILLVAGCKNESASTPTRAPSQQATPGTESTIKPAKDAAASALEFVASPLTAEEIQAGWISLFDGRTLFGWDVPTVTNWHVEDGAIVADSGEKSLLLTPIHFDDFELRCSFHVAEGGNSGIFLRTADNASNPAKDTRKNVGYSE